MGDQLISSIVSVVTAIIGIAIIAVIVRNGSGTVGAINSGSSVFNTVLRQAVSVG